MRRHLSSGRLAAAGLLLLGITALGLWAFPSGSYILLPDKAHPVAPLVSVEGGKDSKDGGGIYYVDVVVRKASYLERMFPGLRDGATIVPAEAIRPPGVSDRASHRADLRAMVRSQSVAAAVALKELGYKVRVRQTGVLVSNVIADAPAAGKLRPSDVVVAVDSRPVRTPRDLRRLIGLHRPGERVRLTVRRESALHQIDLKTVADPAERRRPVIGILVDQEARIELPLSVRIDAGDVGGPSAGLAFALEVLEKLGRDVDRGNKVAATGQIELNGDVSPIGGVRQKVFDARKTRVDAFLVPAGANAAEAKRHAEGLKVIPVRNFHQALQALAALPPKA